MYVCISALFDAPVMVCDVEGYACALFDVPGCVLCIRDVEWYVCALFDVPGCVVCIRDVEPVSYTHLDVYKRQPHTHTPISPCNL